MLPRFLLLACIVAGLHYYIGMQLLPAWQLGSVATTAATSYLIASCLLMPLGLAARRLPSQAIADKLAWAGLLAMGFFSSLLILTIARQILLQIVDLAGVASLGLPATSAQAAVLFALGVTARGYWQARRVAQVMEIDVPLADLPVALHGFRIAQISDIHVGPTIKREYLARIVAKVNALNADFVAITGDLVDGSVAHLAPHTAPLAELRARHGVFFVTGNHEYYSGAAAWITELRRLGVRVLLNEHEILQHDAASLLVAGITDYSAHHFDESQRSDAQAAMRGAPAGDIPKILLAHQPRSADAAAAAGFQLQLSGHTHGGQFWPWNLFVPLQQPYTAGLQRHGSMLIYISRGTGYWGPPKRFGSPSEITLLRLVKA